MTDDSNRYLWPGSPEWLALEEIRLRKESLATMFGGGSTVATLAAGALKQIEDQSIAERTKQIMAEDQAKRGWCANPAPIGSYASLVHDEFMRAAAGLNTPGSPGSQIDTRSLAEAWAKRHWESIVAPTVPTIADWKAQARDDLISTGIGTGIPWGILSGTITDNPALQRVRELYEPDYYARSFLETIKAVGQPDSMIAEAMRTTESPQFRDYLASLDDDAVEELVSSEEIEEEAKEAVLAKLEEAAADPAVASEPKVANDLKRMLELYEAYGSFDAAIKAELVKEKSARQSGISKGPRARKRDQGGASYLCQAVKASSKKRTTDTAWSWMIEAKSSVNFGGFEIVSCTDQRVEYRYKGERKRPIKRTTFDRFFRSPRPEGDKKKS